jgi:hypothetical protein
LGWGIAAIGMLALLPIQAHTELDEVGAVSVRADASDPLGTIFPSDLFTVHDFGQLTRRRACRHCSGAEQRRLRAAGCQVARGRSLPSRAKAILPASQ